MNDKINLKALPENGWEFAYWEGSGISNTISETDLIMTGNLELQAVFAEVLRKSRFQNNFNIHNWSIETNSNWTTEIKDEKYYVRLHVDNLPLSINRTYDSDFYVEADIEFITENHGTYGYIFNFKDWNNYSLFHISTNGYYSIESRIDGKVYYVDEWKSSSLFNTKKGLKNNIGIRKIDDTYTIYVNGDYLNEIKVEEVEDINLGLYVWRDNEGSVEVAFDNIIELSLPY